MPGHDLHRFFEGRIGQGFVEQFLNRPPARLLTELLSKTRIRPTHIVTAGLAVGLTSATLYSLSGHANYVVAAILLQFRSILDCLDGELARAKDMVTDRGHALDGITDFLISLLLHLSIGYGAHVSSGDPSTLLLASASFLSVSFQTGAFFHYKIRLFALSPEPTIRELVPNALTPGTSETDPIVRIERFVFDWIDRPVNGTDVLGYELTSLMSEPGRSELTTARTQLRLLNLWSYLSVGTHHFILILLSLLGLPLTYFYFNLLVGNSLLLILLFLQRREDRHYL